MTPDERNILQSFLSDLAQTPNVAKHAILADQALHAAQAQLQQQSQIAPPQPSFLSPTAQPMSQPWAGPGGAPIQSSPFAANSGLGGFLRAAAPMAAGVAAGDFLFQGIENIFSPRW
jgi:hypothetical protein